MEGVCSSGKTLGLHFRKILCEPWKDELKRVRLEARRSVGCLIVTGS